MGCCRIFRSFYGGCVCPFLQKEKVYRFKAWFSYAESVSFASFCRSCAQWIFLCIKQMDMGVRNDDRLYFCKGISGAFCPYLKRKEKDFYYADCVLRGGALCFSSQDRAQYYGGDGAFVCCFYCRFLWKYICEGKKFMPDVFHASCGEHCAEYFLSVFL